MRYYLGKLEYKWIHAETDMEQLLVQRELGSELFKTVEDNKWCWLLMRSNSITQSGDTYCRTLVFAESNDDKLDTHFVLKFPNVKAIPFAKEQTQH